MLRILPLQALRQGRDWHWLVGFAPPLFLRLTGRKGLVGLREATGSCQRAAQPFIVAKRRPFTATVASLGWGDGEKADEMCAL
jgi:hypothetical protein